MFKKLKQKTTWMGVVAIAIGGWTIAQNPTKATDPDVMGIIGSGMALIVAEDPQPKKKENGRNETDPASSE